MDDRTVKQAEEELGRKLTADEKAEIKAGAEVVNGKIIASSENVPVKQTRR